MFTLKEKRLLQSLVNDEIKRVRERYDEAATNTDPICRNPGFQVLLASKANEKVDEYLEVLAKLMFIEVEG